MILVAKYLIKYLLLIFLILFNSCSTTNNKVIISGNTMGTTYNITLLNLSHDKDILKVEIDKVLKNINQLFSTYIKDSEISNINESGSEIINLSNQFKYVLDIAIDYCKISDGSYDITIGPLIDLWGFNKLEYKRIPSKSEIKSVLDNIGYKKIYLNNSLLVKKNKDIKIDLNSIAKGYGVDKVAELLSSKGYNDYLVEIGGELKSKVSSNNSNGWVIGIQSPKSNSIIKKINLNNFSMATSGTYNNFFEIDNLEYSHILNPKSGNPFKYKTISATVIAENCIDADAYATIAMTMDPIDFISLVESATKGRVEAYLVEYDKNNQIIEYTSRSFNDFFSD